MGLLITSVLNSGIGDRRVGVRIIQYEWQWLALKIERDQSRVMWAAFRSWKGQEKNILSSQKECSPALTLIFSLVR